MPQLLQKGATDLQYVVVDVMKCLELCRCHLCSSCFCAEGETVLVSFWLHHRECSSSVSSYPQISNLSSPYLVLYIHTDVLLAVLLLSL